MLSIKIAHLAELKGLSVSSISQSVSYLVTQRMLPITLHILWAGNTDEVLSTVQTTQQLGLLGVASFPDLSPQQGHTFMIGMLAESGGWKKLDKVGGYDHLPAF